MRLLEKRTEVCTLRLQSETLLCTAPHSTIRLNFVKHVRIFAVVFLKFIVLFDIVCNYGPKFTNFDELFSEIQQFSQAEFWKSEVQKMKMKFCRNFFNSEVQKMMKKIRKYFFPEFAEFCRNSKSRRFPTHLEVSGSIWDWYQFR